MSLLLLSGCAVELQPGVGKTLTVEHRHSMFPEAKEKARTYCAEMGLTDYLVGSDRSGFSWNVSTFECR